MRDTALSTWHTHHICDNCWIKMGSKDVEKLPDGWIRKESRSRPNTVYFFNTTTGKSQWHSPVSSSNSASNSKNEKSKEIKNALSVSPTKGKSTTKSDEKNKPHSTENHTRHKIDDKSRDCKYFQLCFEFSHIRLPVIVYSFTGVSNAVH